MICSYQLMYLEAPRSVTYAPSGAPSIVGRCFRVGNISQLGSHGIDEGSWTFADILGSAMTAPSEVFCFVSIQITTISRTCVCACFCTSQVF